MQSVFLSFPFRPENTVLRDQMVRLVESFDMRLITGESLGGEALRDKIFKRVEACDALIAILTKTHKIEKGGFGSTDWVKGEFEHAKAKKRPSIALVEQGVRYAGPSATDEYIGFKRSNPAEYLLRVAETLATWKREAGRTIKIQILPPDLAKTLGYGDEGVQCRYRLYSPVADAHSEWRVATPVAETGGTFVYLRGVHDDHLIQIDVQHGPAKWRSAATSAFRQVELLSLGAHQ